MRENGHLWLMRFYAAVIVAAGPLEALEGGALKLVVSAACAGIVLQSFLLRRKAAVD